MKNLSLKVCYIISQLLFSDYKISSISGSYILNLRKYKDYNAIYTIGDIHSTIPFISRSGERLDEFYNNNEYFYNLYLEGINIKNKIYENYPNIQNSDEYEVFENNMSFSINCIGAVLNLDNTLNELIELKTSGKPNKNRNYITCFIYNREVYIALIDDFCAKSNYEINNKVIELIEYTN